MTSPNQPDYTDREKLMETLGYHFEPAHPAGCECYEYGSDTTRDGYWKDGDCISAKVVDEALNRYADQRVREALNSLPLDVHKKHATRTSMCIPIRARNALLATLNNTEGK